MALPTGFAHRAVIQRVLSWASCDFSFSEVLQACLTRTRKWLMQIGRERKSPAKVFVQESYPVVSITRSEILAESCRGEINGALLVHIPEFMLMSDNEVMTNLQFFVLSRQAETEYKQGSDRELYQTTLGLFRC